MREIVEVNSNERSLELNHFSTPQHLPHRVKNSKAKRTHTQISRNTQTDILMNIDML